jgi:sulfate adenylyltransferase
MPSRPHGGELVQVSRKDLAESSGRNSSLRVSAETAVTIQNIAQGILSPLQGFMGRNDYQSVLDEMRLENDVPWTIPILLHAPEGFSAGSGDEVDLINGSGTTVGVLAFEESYKIDRKEFAKKVFKTEDESHPGVANAFSQSPWVIGGKIHWACKTQETVFASVTLSPKETRFLFKEKGWKDVVAFQTRNAPHIGHEYVQKTALALADGIFINPVLGKKKPGDFTDEAIVVAYKTLMKGYYPADTAVMSVLNYEMQYAGPREAILHAIMRKNFGCTHIAIGRDHAGVGKFYGPYEAQEIFEEFPDLGITPLFFREFFYCAKCQGIANEKICPHPEPDRLTFSGTKLRAMFQSGEAPPKEFMRPEVADAILSLPQPFVE